MKTEDAIVFAESVLIKRDNSETNEAILMIARGTLVEAQALAAQSENELAQQKALDVVTRLVGGDSWEYHYLARAIGVETGP